MLLISMCGRTDLYGKERFVSLVCVWSLFCKQRLLPPHLSENILKFHCLDILKKWKQYETHINDHFNMKWSLTWTSKQNLHLPFYLRSACYMENSNYSHKLNENHCSNNSNIKRREIEELQKTVTNNLLISPLICDLYLYLDSFIFLKLIIIL